MLRYRIFMCIIDLMALNSNLGLLVTGITATSAVFTIVIVTLITVIVTLARAKHKIQMEMKELRSRTNVVYEEIVIPSTSIDSQKNVAYACVTK